MYDFANEHSLKLNGSLKNYIYNRSSVFEKIKEEHFEVTKETLKTKAVKKAILKGLNEEKYTVRISSRTFKDLQLDFTTIREHIYSMFLNGEMDEYIIPLVLKKGEKKKKKKPFFPKISLQSYYCQGQESVHIIRLIKFLRDKYTKFLKGKEAINCKFTDYYSNTDKQVDLSVKHTLFTVPFFDGVYVSSPEKKFNEDLGSLIKEYNSIDSGSCVKFEEKEIVKNVSHITDEKELENFITIQTWLAKDSSKRLVNALLKRTDVINKFISSLNEIDCKESELPEKESIDELEKKMEKKLGKKLSTDYKYDRDLTEEEPAKRPRWEIDYENLIRDVKASMYKTLLDQGVETEHDIALFIKTLPEHPTEKW